MKKSELKKITNILQKTEEAVQEARRILGNASSRRKHQDDYDRIVDRRFVVLVIPVNYAATVQKIKVAGGVGYNKAVAMLTQMVKDGYLVKAPVGNSNEVIYKLTEPTEL